VREPWKCSLADLGGKAGGKADGDVLPTEKTLFGKQLAACWGPASVIINLS